MPIIARFYGIAIKMYFKEHGIPHFHAIYGEFNGVFNVDTLEMIEGDLPLRAQRLIEEWTKKYQKELKEMWESQKFIKLSDLD